MMPRPGLIRRLPAGDPAMRCASAGSGLVLLAFLALDGPIGGTPRPQDTRRTGSDPVPLTDLRDGGYLGFPGGLYGGGRNAPPPEHRAAGMARARHVVPRDREGN